MGAKTVAGRFEYDMLAVSHYFKSVHTYFCGSKQNNLTRTTNFQTGLLRTEQAPVHFYAGNLATPDRNGSFWAQSNNDYVPLTHCQHIIRSTSIKEETSERLAVKPKPESRFQKRQEKNRESFFSQGKQGRRNLIALYRDTVDSDPVDYTAPAGFGGS